MPKEAKCPQKWGWNCPHNWGGEHICVKSIGHDHPHKCKCGEIV